MFADKERQEQLVIHSGLDWTIIRPTGLTDARSSGPAEAVPSHARKIRWRVPRVDVADLLLKALPDRQMVHQKLTTFAGVLPS